MARDLFYYDYKNMTHIISCIYVNWILFFKKYRLLIKLGEDIDRLFVPSHLIGIRIK